MAATATSTLPVEGRQPQGSREVRRLRRRGLVPGVVYGGDGEPQPFQIDARELRVALAHSGAVLDLQIDGGQGTPVVIKELARHPVNGEITHVDFLRVRLDVEIQAVVALELSGGEEAPGARQGGVLEHVTRELTIESLPNDIPDVITFDVSAMEVGDIVTLETVAASSRYRIVGEPETVIATISAPRLQTEGDDELEQETERVGEGPGSSTESEPAAGESGGEGAGEGDTA